jgi:hypothetical protein
VPRIIPLLVCLSFTSPAALAAEKGKGKTSTKGEKAAGAAAKADEGETPAETKSSSGGRIKPRVYTFGGLDVEGKLKTPSLLFFRARVKQELDTSTPEKRSFLKELEKSADDKGL